MNDWVDLALEAISQFELGNKNIAKDYFEAAIELGPDKAWPYTKFVDLLSEMLDLDKKLSLMEEAVKIEPDDFWANLFFLDMLSNKYKIQDRFYIFEKRFSAQIESNCYLKTKCNKFFAKKINIEKLFSFTDNHKNSLIFVNHDSNFFGATHYLFSLFSEVKAMGVNCCMLDCEENNELYKKHNVLPDDVFSYDNNCFIINEICNLIDPRLVYINSISDSIIEFCNSKKNKWPIITHSHEIHENYSKKIKNPTHVVSKRIREQYEQKNSFSPLVQPPVLTKKIMELIDKEIKKEVILSNKYGSIDLEKIAIGMCGQIDERKNPTLFLEVAKKNRKYNFIWVGGDVDMFENEPNIYHVKTVDLPFKYYMLFDYFILFSLQDPCPYVVLENIYVNNKIITFKDNIYTDHNCELLKNSYFEYDGEVSLDSVCYMIEKHVKEKAKRTISNGKIYVKKNFTSIDKKLIDVLIGKSVS